MSDELRDIDNLFTDSEDPITEGNPEELQEEFNNLPNIDSSTEQQPQEQEPARKTVERNPLDLLPNVLKPTTLKQGYDAATGLVNGQGDDVFREATASVVDFVDNTFLGDQRSKDEILETRDQLTGQGVLDRQKLAEERSGPNVVSETIGLPIGTALGTLESVLELGELAGDAIELPGRWVSGKLDPSDIPFHNKYEWAQWNLGRSTFGTKSAAGNFLTGLWEFAIALKHTGGLRGLKGTRAAMRPEGTFFRPAHYTQPTAKVLNRYWQRGGGGFGKAVGKTELLRHVHRASAVAKAGSIGAAAGIPADLLTTITQPEQSNLTNLLEEWNPALKDTWLTALAVDEDDSMIEAMFKTSLEGYGLGYAADAAGVIIVGHRVFKQAIKQGIDPETAKRLAGKEAYEYQKLQEPYSAQSIRPEQDIDVAFPPHDLGRYEFWRLGSDTANTNLFGELGEVAETLRSYSVDDQVRWYKKAKFDRDQNEYFLPFLSLEAQFKIKGGDAQRLFQLPNGTIVKFDFHRFGTTSVDSDRISSKEVSIAWDVKSKGIKGRNLEEGIDPASDYGKKWKEWYDGGEQGPGPVRPDQEDLGKYSRRIVREIQTVIREEIEAGTIVTNTPLEDIETGLSGAQARRAAEWAEKNLPKETEQLFLDNFIEDEGSSGWKRVLEQVQNDRNYYGSENALDENDAFELLKKINDKPNAKNAWQALTPEQQLYAFEQFVSNQMLERPKGMEEMPNIRRDLYKRAGFGDLDYRGAQTAIARSSPDGRNRWLTPINEVLDEFGNRDPVATEAKTFETWRAQINPIAIANDYIFNTSTGVGVYEGRIERYLKLRIQQERGIPITWDDVKAVFPEYFVTGTRQPITEIPRQILEDIEGFKVSAELAGMKDASARDLDGNIITEGFLVDIDGVSLNKLDEQSINDFLTKNSQLLTREDVAIYYGVSKEGKPTLQLHRLVAADDEAQALGLLFDQVDIKNATGWVQSDSPAGLAYRFTNYQQIISNPDIQKAFKEAYIENYRQSDWDQYMENAPPGEYEKTFDAFVGDGLLNLRDFMSDPPPGLEFTGGGATGRAGKVEGVDFELIDTYGIDQLKDTKGDHLESMVTKPHERRTVTPTEAAAQQLAQSQEPNLGQGTGSGVQRVMTNAQVRNLSQGSPEGVREAMEMMIKDTPIRISELAKERQLSDRAVVEEALKGLADAFDEVTGEIDITKLEYKNYGETSVLLSDVGIVQSRMLLQEMSKGIWESSRSIVELGNAGEDTFKHVEMLVHQWKVLARMHKISSNMHSHLLHSSAIKLPWGGELPISIKQDQSKLLNKLKDGEKVLNELVDRLKTGDAQAKREAMRIANTLLLADGNISIHNKLWQYIGEVSVGQGLKIMYNSLLSAPATHAVNIISSAINTVYRPIAAATGGDVKTKRMAAAGFHGFQQTLMDSWTMAEKVMKNGGKAINDGGKGIVIDAEINAKLDLLRQSAISSDDKGYKFGVGFLDFTHTIANFPLFSWPSNLLVTSDEFFKTMNARIEYNTKVMGVAIDEAGKSGKDIDDVFEKLLKDNIDQNFDKKTGAILNDDLLDVAKETTFQTDLEGPAKTFAHFINEAPGLRIFFPFVKTGHNIMVYAGEHVPLLNRQLTEYKKVMAGNDEYAKAVMKGREAYGRMMVIAGGLAAYNGVITGNGPMDPDEKKLWLRSHKPRSIKIGNKWINYDRIEPLGQILAGTADIFYYFQTRQLQEQDAEYLSGYLTYSIASNLTQKSFFQGLVPLGRLLTPGWQGKTALSRLTADTINAFIPLSAARRSFANLHTPYYQEFTNVFSDKLANQLTWGFAKGDDQYDWLTGEKITNDRGGINSIFPLQVNERGSSIVHDKLEDIQFDSSVVIKELLGIDLTAEQKAFFSKTLGNSNMYRELEKWVTNPAFDKGLKQFKLDLQAGKNVRKKNEYWYRKINTIINAYSKDAKKELYRRFPELKAEIRDLELNRMEQRGGTRRQNAVQELADF